MKHVSCYNFAVQSFWSRRKELQMTEKPSLIDRMVRAAKLDSNLYEEVEADKGANGQAFTVVLIASIASGLGGGIAAIISGDSGIWFLWGLLIGIGTGIVGWLIWSLLAYLLGTTIFKGPETEADYGQLIRTIGFSNTPRLLSFFSFIPFLGGVISFVAFVWALVAGVIAIRQALDFSTWRAIGTCIVGWLIYTLIVFLVSGFAIGANILF
jgi:Yip1 domain